MLIHEDALTRRQRNVGVFQVRVSHFLGRCGHTKATPFGLGTTIWSIPGPDDALPGGFSGSTPGQADLPRPWPEKEGE